MFHKEGNPVRVADEYYGEYVTTSRSTVSRNNVFVPSYPPPYNINYYGFNLSNMSYYSQCIE